jgi:alpha-1,4-galacturonosyltransferase
LYRMLFYSLFFFLFLLGFMFLLTKVGSIDDENKCSNTGTLLHYLPLCQQIH